MMKSVIYLNKISIKNLKNVYNGSIVFKKEYNKESLKHITGIYGQNGSGKTSIIDALVLLKNLMLGKRLSNNFLYLISADKENMVLDFEFFMDYEDKSYKIFYEVELSKTDDYLNKANIQEEDNDKENSFIKITKEKMSYSKFDNEKWTRKCDILNYEYENKKIPFTPKKTYEEMVSKQKDNELDLKFQKEFSKRLCKSYIFNNDNIKIFEQTLTEESELVKIIKDMQYFARYNLFIVENDETGVINTFGIMPFSFRIEDQDGISTGVIAIKLFDVTTIGKQKLDTLNKIISQINIVVGSIVPDLSIKLKNYGLEILSDGKEGYRVELLSNRGEIEIPLKYESDGIKKIISILSALIAMYNNEQILLAVDELDAGVFEYLLGEILDVIKDNCKGQFIFTSHNLRALEKLDKDSIVFTTTNPENRYIKFTSVKNTNNLRDFYLRGILLGGQKEEIYNGTNKAYISRAFRKAWRG